MPKRDELLANGDREKLRRLILTASGSLFGFLASFSVVGFFSGYPLDGFAAFFMAISALCLLSGSEEGDAKG